MGPCLVPTSAAPEYLLKPDSALPVVAMVLKLPSVVSNTPG